MGYRSVLAQKKIEWKYFSFKELATRNCEKKPSGV